MELKHDQLKNVLTKLDHLNNINNLKKSHTWKIQSMISINFMSSKDTDEDRLMHSESDIIEILISDKEGKIIEEFFQSLLSRYQVR